MERAPRALLLIALQLNLGVIRQQAIMKRRIRKKKIDAVDRLLADGLRLFAERPRPRRDPEAFEKVSRGFASLSIGLALRERLQRLPGPRRGFEMDPPRAFEISMPDADTIHASGMVLIRDRQGEEEIATESFKLSARKHRGCWRMTRVVMLPVARHIWEASENT
jgi:hypothetical protein